MAKTAQNSKVYKLVYFLFLFVLSLFILKYSFSINTVHAQVPAPKVPCGSSSDPEFHSLRPYQASPCGDSDKALYCGNDILIYETAEHTLTSSNQGICSINEYNVNKPVDKTYEIALKDMELPILGNTQDVKNSQSADPGFNDATKLNEYVSWYLSGANAKAETGTSTNDQVVNFSGPIQKLFPSAIQDFQRIQTIESVTKTVIPNVGDSKPTSATNVAPTSTGCYPPGRGGCAGDIACAAGACCPSQNACSTFLSQNPNSVTSGQQFQNLQNATNEPSNHNQTVVCQSGGKPVECPSGKPVKLLDWNDTLSILRSISNVIVNQATNIPGIGNLVASVVTDAWNLRTPPLPWDDGTGKPFKTELYYQKAYNEWRGKSCIIIPLINKLICIDNPGVTNMYADLYQYVPLANTSDKNAKVWVPEGHAEVKAIGDTVINPERPHSQILDEPALFFAHTQEDAQLSSLLKSIYNPQKGTSEDIDPLTTEPDRDEKGQCRVIDVRTNEGDNLFAEVKPDSYVAKVEPYTIVTIPCNSACTQSTKVDKITHRISTVYSKKCEGGVTVTIKTQTKTPYAKEIYKNTVAGSDSIFRKIFPKVEPGAPVECIANIPTVSNATYEIVGGTDKIQVKEPDGTKTDGTGSKLYFPYIGSVYEYFLKGIQTALRPLGYGEPITNGQFCKNIEEGDCSWNMAKINQGIQNAANKYNVPASLLKAIFEIEMADEINDPSKYQCQKEDPYGSIGVAQMKKASYNLIVCGGEKMDNDIGICGNTPGKLSRCNFSDSFELMARLLLLNAGKLSGCKSIGGGISLSNKMEWYNAACNYGTGFGPTDLTINYANEIPASEKRQDGDMNYCDIICWKLGQCSGSNYPAR